MPVLSQQSIRAYEQSILYGIIHNFQKTEDDDHLIIFRKPVESKAVEDNDMRSKNPEKNLRRQEQNRNYNQGNNNQRVANDLGSFLGNGEPITTNLGQQYGNNDQYNSDQYNNGFALPQPGVNQLPQPGNNQLPQTNLPTQQINPQPDYQVDTNANNNSLNSPQMHEVSNTSDTYFDLNQPNYYQTPNINPNGYYQGNQQELPQPVPTQQPTQVEVSTEQPTVTQPDPEPQDEATITYTDANGNPTNQEEIPVDMPNTLQQPVTQPDEYIEQPILTDNEAESSAIKRVEPVTPQQEETNNSLEKSKIFQEIQGAINTRKWLDSVQEIKIAKKANFENMPIDHIDLIGITNGVSDGIPYRLDLDPTFFKLFKIIIIGKNLDITLLARDGESTEITIAPPDWVQNDDHKDILIDGDYTYSYDPNLDFDKLMQTLYRFTYRPVETKGYTELFITDLPIYPIMNKD